MSEFEIWAYRIVIVALAGVLWWAIQWAVKRVTSKIDELIRAIDDLTATSKVQQEQIVTINNLIAAQNNRLTDHAKRIRSLELKNAECNTCTRNARVPNQRKGGSGQSSGPD